MKRVLIAPGKIVLGSGELRNLGAYIRGYGEKALLIASTEDRHRVDQVLRQSSEENGVTFLYEDFSGECSDKEIQRIQEAWVSSDYGCVIGLGGGKGIDTAKIIADIQGLPMVSVPTIAATDAPCSSLAVLYDDNHVVIGGRFLKKSPALVLIDSEIIAKAPKRFLAAGMGDAFATWFEARACRASGAIVNGGFSTLSAYSLARLCYETLLEKGEDALKACENGVVTPALEDIIEVNIVMSGIGFESVGVAAAHGLLGCLEILGADKAMHGEIVAFGTLVQLVMENAPREEIDTALAFYKKIGLPVKLSDLGIGEVSKEQLKHAAAHAVNEQDALIHNMPFELNADLVANSILTANNLTKYMDSGVSI